MQNEDMANTEVLADKPVWYNAGKFEERFRMFAQSHVFSHSNIQYTKIPGFMEATIFQTPVMQICLKETVSDTNTSNRIFFIDYPASIPSFIPKANLLKSSL